MSRRLYYAAEKGFIEYHQIRKMNIQSLSRIAYSHTSQERERAERPYRQKRVYGGGTQAVLSDEIITQFASHPTPPIKLSHHIQALGHTNREITNT